MKSNYFTKIALNIVTIFVFSTPLNFPVANFAQIQDLHELGQNKIAHNPNIMIFQKIKFTNIMNTLNINYLPPK